jgi:cytochrome c-type biogenesis protein
VTELAQIGRTFADIADHGALLVAIPVAMVAGLVSFLSPCVLPLVPGYLSYVTGLSGAQLAGAAGSGEHPRRGRVLLGSLLFVLGFAVVFVMYGVLAGLVGTTLTRNLDTIIRVVGVFTIAMGLLFMGILDWLPGVNRDVRFHRLPAAGLAGAPVLGLVFGLGWTPCLGPTAGAVVTLMLDSASAGRGAILGLAYALGIGIPFIVAGVAFNRAASAFAVVKRHYALVTRAGGAFLVLLGLLQVSGVWNAFMLWMQVRIRGVETPL